MSLCLVIFILRLKRFHSASEIIFADIYIYEGYFKILFNAFIFCESKKDKKKR